MSYAGILGPGTHESQGIGEDDGFKGCDRKSGVKNMLVENGFIRFRTLFPS
jgi:hypothetical protein